MALVWHSTYAVARLYAMDALMLKQLSNVYNNSDNHVGKWQMIVASQLMQAAQLNMHSSAYCLPPPDLATTFVVDSFGLLNATQSDQQLIISTALKYIKPSAPEAELKKIFLEIGLAKDNIELINCLITQMVKFEKKGLEEEQAKLEANCNQEENNKLTILTSKKRK